MRVISKMKEPTFKANCVICGKEQTYIGKKSEKRRGEVYLCSKECSIKFNEQQLKLQRKNTVLPTWLLNKGVIDNFPNIHFRNFDKRVLMHMKKNLKKIKSKKEKEVLKVTIKHLEDVLKSPNTMYMADDVEKAFREAFKK